MRYRHQIFFLLMTLLSFGVCAKDSNSGKPAQTFPYSSHYPVELSYYSKEHSSPKPGSFEFVDLKKELQKNKLAKGLPQDPPQDLSQGPANLLFPQKNSTKEHKSADVTAGKNDTSKIRMPKLPFIDTNSPDLVSQEAATKAEKIEEKETIVEPKKLSGTSTSIDATPTYDKNIQQEEKKAKPDKNQDKDKNKNKDESKSQGTGTAAPLIPEEKQKNPIQNTIYSPVSAEQTIIFLGEQLGREIASKIKSTSLPLYFDGTYNSPGKKLFAQSVLKSLRTQSIPIAPRPIGTYVSLVVQAKHTLLPHQATTEGGLRVNGKTPEVQTILYYQVYDRKTVFASGHYKVNLFYEDTKLFDLKLFATSLLDMN